MQPRAAKKSRRNLLPLYALLLAVAVIVGFVVYDFCQKEPAESIQGKGVGRITEKANPAKARQAAREGLPANERIVRRFDEIEKPVIDKAEPIIEQKKGRIITWEPKGEPIFKGFTDSHIADLLTAAPGEELIGFTFDPEFEDEFKESLKHPIVIAPDDPEDVVVLKKAVIKAKEEIAARVSKGEKAADILTEAREEINQIASYRKKLDSNLELMCSIEQDPEIVRMYAKDCDKQLDEYGLPHLDLPESDEELLDYMKECREREAAMNEKEEKK